MNYALCIMNYALCIMNYEFYYFVQLAVQSFEASTAPA